MNYLTLHVLPRSLRAGLPVFVKRFFTPGRRVLTGRAENAVSAGVKFGETHSYLVLMARNVSTAVFVALEAATIGGCHHSHSFD